MTSQPMQPNVEGVKVWYSQPIEMIRVTASPGGMAIDVEQAKEFRDELDEVIRQAEEAADDEE